MFSSGFLNLPDHFNVPASCSHNASVDILTWSVILSVNDSQVSNLGMAFTGRLLASEIYILLVVWEILLVS